jgi:hypothetical protein
VLFESPFTLLALVIPPLVAIVFIAIYIFKREPASQPSVIAAIPLCLTSITILLGQSAVLILSAFRAIATQKASGLAAVITGLQRAQQPLVDGFLDLTVCLILILLFATILNSVRAHEDEDAPLLHAYISLPALIITSCLLLSVFLIVYLQYSTVDLVMMIVDTNRNSEVASQIGAMNISKLAASISYRLIATAFLSFFLFFACLVSAALALFWRNKQDHRQTFATILVIAALAGCGLSLLEELSFIHYIQNLH